MHASCVVPLMVAVQADPAAALLRRLQAAMVQTFGHARRAPADRPAPEWALVQGLIGSRMPSGQSSAVADRLLAQHGSWNAVAALPLADLTAALKGVRFPNQAAKRVHDVLNAVRERVGSVSLSTLTAMTDDEAMGWLEALPGTGRKIAAQVLNTSPLARRVLVIDTHHLRITQRLGLVAAKADAAQAFAPLMALSPEEWTAADLDEHHMLMKKLGQTFCKPTTPLCRDCPALSLCPTGAARTGGI